MRQKESVARLFAVAALTMCWATVADAQAALDTGGLTLKDFSVADNGASFSRNDSVAPTGLGSARLIGVENASGRARVGFDSIKVEAVIPMGWQVGGDQERGLAFNSDRSVRLIIWRLDFAFEGVKDPDHYGATKVGAIQSRRPGVKGRTQHLADGAVLIVYENVPAGQGDRETRTVYDLVLASPSKPSEGLLVTVGVPASQAARGLNLLALIRQDLKITW